MEESYVVSAASHEPQIALELHVLDLELFQNIWDLVCIRSCKEPSDEWALLQDWKMVCITPWHEFWPNSISYLTKHLRSFDDIHAVILEHVDILDSTTGMSRCLVPFGDLHISLQNALTHEYHGGKYIMHLDGCRYETAGDAVVRLGLDDICTISRVIFGVLGMDVPSRYTLGSKKHEPDIARYAARNKIMAIVYDGLGYCELSGFSYTTSWVDLEDSSTKIKASLFEMIIARLYAKGVSGNRKALRLVYMFLQLLVWLADSDDSSNDPCVHYKANIFSTTFLSAEDVNSFESIS